MDIGHSIARAQNQIAYYALIEDAKAPPNGR